MKKVLNSIRTTFKTTWWEVICIWPEVRARFKWFSYCLSWQRRLSVAVDCTVASVERLRYRWGSGEPTVTDVLPVIQTLWDWRLQRLKEQKKHAGVRLNKALSTPDLSGDYKGQSCSSQSTSNPDQRSEQAAGKLLKEFRLYANTYNRCHIFFGEMMNTLSLQRCAYLSHQCLFKTNVTGRRSNPGKNKMLS